MFEAQMTRTPLRDGPEHGPVQVGCKAEPETALHLLKTCVAAEVSCFGQVLAYLGNHRHKAQGLLEDVLTLENAHAQELIGVLQAHGVGGEVRRNGLSNPVARR